MTSFPIYRVSRTRIDFPWRYCVSEDGEVIALTFTKWGAERLVRLIKKDLGI